VVSAAAAGTDSLRTLGAASEKESTSTNSFSEPDGQLSQKLNRGQKQTPFRLSVSTKASSSKAEGTRRTPTEETFFTAFFNFLRPIWARPEAAWSSASEVRLEVLRLRFDDSRDLVLEGLTPEEVPSPTDDDELRFEDLIRGALMGAAEQLATATAGTFSLGPGPRELKDLSPQTSENTRLILLLCFTRALYALYSFMVYSPIMTFTLFSISAMKASAL
jgi:hypothetical protein